MPASPSTNETIPRSGFVTGIAWTFIAFAGFATLIAVLQNVMLTFLVPLEDMREAMHEAEGAHQMPAFARFMFEHFRLVFAAFLLFSIITLISAIGLLKRKNWARLIFIGIMATGIVWNLASIPMPFLLLSSFPPVPEHAPADFRDQFDLMWKVMTVFTILMAVAFSVLFGWIIKRLISQDVRREFHAL